MNFINYEQLLKDVENFAKTLPRFDMVIGIPRSGIIPAALLAMYWNVPFKSIEAIDRQLIYSWRFPNKPIKNILVLDDSLHGGRTMSWAKKLLNNNKEYNFKYAVVYIHPKRTNKVDYYYKILDIPRTFQWCCMHHGYSKYSFSDMDGVLCRPPTHEENDYGPKYELFINNTEQWHNPTFGLDKIVTGRIEKYRTQTEDWLKKHNVEYNELLMRKDRREPIVNYKAKHYINSEAVLFYEDEPWQAKQIACITGKKVLCTTDWKIYEGDKN